MGRPVVTAAMLEDLRREGVDIHLRKDALITPAARDWLKEHEVPVTWTEPGQVGSGGGSLAVVMDPALPEMRVMRTLLDRAGGAAEVIEPGKGPSGIAQATRQLCGKIARQEAAKGVVFAADGATPVCVANKHNGIRAALGMSLPMVEEACRELGINVLVIEYPTQTTYQMKQMIERLLKSPAAAGKDTAAVIQEIELSKLSS